MKRRCMKLFSGLAGLVMMAGCAAPGMNVTIGYTPFVNASGGSGELFLVQDSVPEVTQKALWVIGELKGYDGEKDHELVVPGMPIDLVTTMLADELTSAGYLVKQAKTMPEQPAKVVRISSVKLALDESLSFMNFKLDATGSLGMNLELWLNGTRVNSFDYRASFSDSGFKDGDQLGSTVLKNSVRDVMKQAVPDIMKSLEKK